MHDRQLDLEAIFSPGRAVTDVERLRAWCDALPVQEPVTVSLGLDDPLRQTPTIVVQFAARSHVLGAACEAEIEAAWNGGETFASGCDPVVVSQRLIERLEKLEPDEGVDVWVGAAAELSPHVMALVFNAAAFLARIRLGGVDHALEIVVSEPAVAEVFRDEAHAPPAA